MQLKNSEDTFLVSGQSMNMILISSCSISATFEPFSIVLTCMCVLLGAKIGKIFSRIEIRL